MKEFKVLNEKKAKEVTFQIMLFLKKFPLSPDYPNKENDILSHIFKYLNLIFYHDLKNPKFDVSIGVVIENKDQKIDIFENSSFLLQRFHNELKDNITIKGLSYLLELNTSFLKIENINLHHKTNILDAENSILNQKIEQLIDLDNEKIIDDFIFERLKITFESIYSFDEVFKGNSNFTQTKDPLIGVLNRYLGFKINTHLYRNQIFQIIKYLKDELNQNEDNDIRKTLIQKLVDINCRFLIEPKEVYFELLDANEVLFTSEELEHMNSLIQSNPKGMEISSFKFGQGQISSEIIKNKRIHTIIRFSIPYGGSNNSGTIPVNDQITIQYKHLKNRFSDPVFKLFKDWSIGGMGWNFFMDTFNSDNKINTSIALIISNFYNPDLELNETGYSEINFSEKKALIGRDFYPHKEFVIEKLYQNSEKIITELGIKKEDININLFSNYIVDYFDLDKKSILFRRMFSITNPSAYLEASDRFMERLNELSLSDSYISIRELVERTNIVSNKSLRIFIQALLDIVVKNNIELQSNYKYFWKLVKGKLKPQNEPEMQPLIMGQLKAICDYMGIQISREVESANGEIDFLCSYSYNQRIFKTCIELKNAHSPKIELGLTKQLPQYLKSERTKNGIYLILWYKGDLFNKPEKYKDIRELTEYLYSKNSKEFQIEILGINCNKPIVPSKLK